MSFKKNFECGNSVSHVVNSSLAQGFEVVAAPFRHEILHSKFSRLSAYNMNQIKKIYGIFHGTRDYQGNPIDCYSKVDLSCSFSEPPGVDRFRERCEVRIRIFGNLSR